MLQVVIAFISGAVWEADDFEDKLMDAGGKEELDRVMEQRKVQMRCWALLFSHTTGFAAIFAGGSIQQTLLSSSPAQAIAIVPLMFCGFLFVGRCLRLARRVLMEQGDQRIDRREDLWDAEVIESENDVAGLSLSFLTVQAIRFYLTGYLPMELGQGTAQSPNSYAVTGLLVSSVVFAGFTAATSVVAHRLEHARHHGEGHERIRFCDVQSVAARAIEEIKMMCAMAFAWCNLYAFKIQLHHLWPGLLIESVIARVLLALVIWCFAFCVIILLDAVDDNDVMSAEYEQGLLATINALGILVGFSWEQSFDGAVEVIAEDLKERASPLLVETVLALFVVTVITPAWQWYILTKVMKLQAEDAAERERELEEQHFAEASAAAAAAGLPPPVPVVTQYQPVAREAVDEKPNGVVYALAPEASGQPLALTPVPEQEFLYQHY